MTPRIAIASLVLILSATFGFAQSDPMFVQLPGRAKAALYMPDSGPAPHVGIVVTHRTGNNMSGLQNVELSQRGFMVLGLNSRFENNEASVMWEDIALDVKSAVEYARRQPGITTVLLYGGSGGGPTMSFYQAVAEKGPSYCQGPNKLVQCTDALANLPPADGVILRDPHPGNSVNAVRSLNGAVLDESNPHQIDPDLDPYNPNNGFNPNGPSKYSEEFKQRYFRAQSDRMNRLVDMALGKLEQMEQGMGTFSDDDALLIPRGIGARLMQLDPSIHHSTVQPQKLLQNDGTVSMQIVESVRPAFLNQKEANATFNDGTRFLTLRSFLSANAIRSNDSMDDIDWCSSNNSTPCALQNISVPILLGAMGGHYFIRDNEIHYEVAASEDKDYIIVEGALHGVRPCTACETTPGQYSNSVQNFFDYVANWINARF